MAAKFQNRKGMSGITVRGKNVYYKTGNVKDLANKLGIMQSEAREYIKNQSKLIVKDGVVEKIDLRKNPLPFLRREYGIQRIANKKLLDEEVTIKNATFINEIPENSRVTIIVVIKMTLQWESSIDPYEKKVTYLREKRTKEIQLVKVRSKDIGKKVMDFAEDFAAKAYANLVKLSFVPITVRDNIPLTWSKGRLRENYVYDITEFSNIRYTKEKNGNCVKEYLKEKYPKISKKYISSLGNEDGVSIEEIEEFCNKYEIKFFIYDVLGRLHYSNPELERNKSYASLAFIAFNNHIYPLDTTKPKKSHKDKHEIQIVDTCLDQIEMFLALRIIPYNICVDLVNNNPEKIADVNIISYCYDGVKYIANNDYLFCQKILSELKMEDKIYDSIKKGNLASIIEKFFISENIDSFFPNQHLFNKPGFTYKTEKRIIKFSYEIDPEEDEQNDCIYKKENRKVMEKRTISTIDKNKAYTYSLYTLPYLIVVDWRGAKITKNPKKIIDHYLYIASPEKSNILIPNTNLYSGYFLKICKKHNIKFTLIEEITTTIVINNYKRMIDYMINKLKIPMVDIKNMINILIGKFERSTNVKINHIFKGLLNNDEASRTEGFGIDLDEEHRLVFDTEEKVTQIYNRKPIAVQVKDMCRLLIFDKMVELKLREEDIIQIKTDSLTYYGELPDDLDPNDFYGWKKEEFNEFEDIPIILDNPNLTFEFGNTITNTRDNLEPKFTRKLHNCYAGSGKTTYIINELIPYLIKNKIRFRVLTPSHEALEEYKKINVPCDVIQKYIYRNIPTEDYIIIDEIGFVNSEGQELIYKMSHLEKNYESFGDFGQLPPVETKKKVIDFSKEHYNNYLYNDTQTHLNKNHRNNFPHYYYELLKNEEIDVLDEVLKYSTEEYYEADVILCYRNCIRDKYNMLMLRHHKLNLGDVGVKYICRTNKLLDEYDIYNHKKVSIVAKIEDEDYPGTFYYLLSDENFITQKQLCSNFVLGYAMNVYNIQGKSINSYYWAPEDDNRFTNNKYEYKGRLAYTIISRLIGDVFKKDIVEV